MIAESITIEDILAVRPEIKAFIFDLDGTIVNSMEGIITTVLEYLFEKEQQQFSREKIEELFGTPLEKLFKILIPRLTEEETMLYLKEIRAKYAENHTEITPLFPEVKALLEELHAKGYKMGVASTKFKKFVVEILEHYNILDFFDVVLSGYEVANHKPAPDILLKAAEMLDLTPKECLYIGDAPTDVEAGKRAGMVTIAVLTGPHGSEKFNEEKSSPEFMIENLSKIQASL